MIAINYSKLVKLAESRDNLVAAFQAKQVKPTDIDLGRLFAECFGWSAFMECRAGKRLANDVMNERLVEATGAVSTAQFLNVSGQFVYQTVLDAYTAEEFIFTQLIPEAPAATLQGEKIPGITQIGDEAAVRNEGDPYAIAGVGEDWVFTPQIKDRGMIVPVTWEALFNDKTGQLAQRCNDVGHWIGVNAEKRAIDCVIDENTTAHRYNWRGTVIASYGDNSGTHSWDNLNASNALVDWLQLNTVEQNFNAVVDPYTGEPALWDPKHLIVYKGLEQTAYRILHATEIRVLTPGYATSGNPTQTNVANPYMGKYELKTSRLLAARLAVDTSWFLGDVGKYAKRMVAEKMNVVQAPTNNQDEFHRRIVSQYRANEQSAFVVVQPRAMQKSTA